MFGRQSVEAVNDACFTVLDTMSAVRKLDIALYSMNAPHDMSLPDINQSVDKVRQHFEALDPVTKSGHTGVTGADLTQLQNDLVEELGRAPAQALVREKIVDEVFKRKVELKKRQDKAARIIQRSPLEITLFGDNIVSPLYAYKSAMTPKRIGESMLITYVHYVGAEGAPKEPRYYGFHGYYISTAVRDEKGSVLISVVNEQGDVQVDLRAASKKS